MSQRHLTKSSSYYGLLTCYRSLQAKDIRKKLDVIGITIETGSYTATRQRTYSCYTFKNESFYNVMCSNLSSLVQKSIAKSTKRSDRIPMSLRPARPVYSKLKCCLELSLTPGSFSAAINTLHPLFVTLAQSLFYITANGTKEDDVTPCTPSVPEPNRIPAFALCLQFNKVIFKKTIKFLVREVGVCSTSSLATNRYFAMQTLCMENQCHTFYARPGKSPVCKDRLLVLVWLFIYSCLGMKRLC